MGSVCVKDDEEIQETMERRYFRKLKNQSVNQHSQITTTTRAGSSLDYEIFDEKLKRFRTVPSLDVETSSLRRLRKDSSQQNTPI
ncbi:hypothetical protein pb186bvf_011535 [Paramecium bursaria]